MNVRVLLTLLAGLVLFAAAPAGAREARPVGDVPAGKTLLVIGQSGVDKADAVESATGVRPAGAMFYFGVYEDPEPFLREIEAAVRSHPGLVVNLGLSFGAASTPSPPYTPAIAAGAYDDNLAKLAAALKRLKTVVYVRPGYEFDLLGGQYGPPEAYKLAYRRVVDQLRGHGVRNASFVWHSAGAFWRGADPSLFATGSGSVAKAVQGAPALPITAFYPGRSYVDAFGISYWQDSCCFGRSSQQARDVYEQRTREILTEARGLGLPLEISEATPAYVGADSGRKSVEWLDNTFELVQYFDIRSLSLISIDWRAGGFFAAPFWNGYWPDARIHHFPDTRARFVAEMAGDRYVQRSETLPKRLGLPTQRRKARRRSVRPRAQARALGRATYRRARR